jgi:membrane associated rhomboid family serine protease
LGEAHHYCLHGNLPAGVRDDALVPLADRPRWVDEWFALIPVFVMKGEIWQLVTYSLLHANFSHVFFNMLTLWFIGGYLESDWGPRRFIECYTFCVVGAALVTIAVSYTHFLGMNGRGTVGASGGIFGLLMAFGILYADQEMYLFPLPFRIKAKYLVGIWVIVAIVAVFEPTRGKSQFLPTSADCFSASFG